MNINHHVIGRLKTRNPVILSAGILGDSPKMLKEAYAAGAGAVITKTITTEPRKGNPTPNKIKHDGWHLNWVGLNNPGVKKFSKTLGTPNYPCLVSLAADTPSEFAELAGMFDGIIGFELNISCPNVEGKCINVENNPSLMNSILSSMKKVTDLPIFVKVGFQMYKTVSAAVDAGADGITAINTIPGLCFVSNTSFHTGGLSGAPLRALGLKMVYDIVNEYDIPVIGCGGISNWSDAAEYLTLGAAAVQIGTAAMYDLSILEKIVKGLEIHEK